jgi:antitoxin CcdA
MGTARDVTTGEMSGCLASNFPSTGAMCAIMRMNIHMENQMGRTVEALPRKPTNVTLPVDIYEEGKALSLNFSRIFEQAMREAIRLEHGRRWAEENADFIQAHNEFVEKHGVPLAEYRMF